MPVATEALLITCEGIRTEPNYIQSLIDGLSLDGVTAETVL